MTTAKQVIDIAKKEIGYQEIPGKPNIVKYWDWYDKRMQGQPWCGAFVSWVLAQAGLNTHKFAYCPTAVQDFKNKKQWYLKPEPGDIAFFTWNPQRIPQHTGIVLEVNGTYILTIEGNTSSGTVGSQDNGDGVYTRKRYLKDCVGFGRPEYTK